MDIYQSTTVGITRNESICEFFIIREIIADPAAVTVSFRLHFWCVQADIAAGHDPDNERIVVLPLIVGETDDQRIAALFAGGPYVQDGETIDVSGATIIGQ